MIKLSTYIHPIKLGFINVSPTTVNSNIVIYNASKDDKTIVVPSITETYYLLWDNGDILCFDDNSKILY